jgi:hypothetical protein
MTSRVAFAYPESSLRPPHVCQASDRFEIPRNAQPIYAMSG